MQQTKPVFLIRKYRSILGAAMIVEAVSFLVSLTDSIVAGNMFGEEALAAIGLVTPFMAFSTFVSSIINSGTTMNFSYQVGRFDKRRALEFFSQGVYMALISGALYAGGMLVLFYALLPRFPLDFEIIEYTVQYLKIIPLYFLLNPLSYLLDNLLVADGGEKLSAAANIIMIFANIILSIVFAGRWGIAGVAAASVLCKVLFILMISLHFFSRTNTLHLILVWKWRDIAEIVRSGIVKASIYALEGLTFILLYMFVAYYFGEDQVIVVAMTEKYLGVLTMFIGLSMAAQPMICTLRGENNSKALRSLMRTVCTDIAAAGAVLSLLTMLSAPLLVSAFGIDEEPFYGEGVRALRIVSSTLVVQGILVLFFIYYYLMDRQALAFFVGLFKNLITPLVLVILISVLTKSQVGIWTGLAAAACLSLIICAQVIYKRYSREMFPLLLQKDNDRNCYIFDFVISPEACAEMSRTAGEIFSTFPVSAKERMLADVFVEDYFMLVLEKNGMKKNILAECTIIASDTGMSLILRDSGVLFDVMDEDVLPDSFRQYVIANMLPAYDKKAYLPTTGYNRVEIVLDPCGQA